MRDVTIPIMIRVMKIGESVVVRRPFHPDVIDPDFFVRLQVVVNNHSPGAHDSHFSDLSGLEPTALNGSKALLPERQRDVSHVLNSRSDMGVALAVNS